MENIYISIYSLRCVSSKYCYFTIEIILLLFFFLILYKYYFIWYLLVIFDMHDNKLHSDNKDHYFNLCSCRISFPYHLYWLLLYFNMFIRWNSIFTKNMNMTMSKYDVHAISKFSTPIWSYIHKLESNSEYNMHWLLPTTYNYIIK